MPAKKIKKIESGFDALIEALTILKKYGKGGYAPTHCEHDVLYICDGVDPDKVTTKDKKRLDELGFFEPDGESTFISFRFGSC